MGYDSEFDSGYEEAGKVFGVGLLFLVVTIVVLAVLGYFMIFTNTIIEHKVFTNSHQYKEGRKTEMSIYEAQLAAIEVQLQNPSLDDQTRINLEAQKVSITILNNAATVRE